MRSNIQGNYTSNDFDAFCRETRIKRELIMPYTCSRNGVIEKNGFIIERDKVMIHDKDLAIKQTRL